MAQLIQREEIAPGVTVVGRNGRRREVIDIDSDDDGRELVIYRMVKSPRQSGQRHGMGYVGACQLPQMLRWARKVLKEHE